MIRPTLRAALFFAAGIPPAILLLIAEPNLWLLPLFYAALALALTAVDALLIFPERALHITFTAPGRLYVGERGMLSLEIATPTTGEAIGFEMLPELTGPAEPVEAVRRVSAEGGVRLEAGLQALRRGRVVIEAMWLRWPGPFGLVECRTRTVTNRGIDILPDIRRIESAALQFSADDSIYGVKVRRQKGEGTEFEALREFAPGHDHRMVDWKHSARHRKLLTREFRTERNNPVILAFDTGHLMLEPIGGLTRLDHAIEAALLLGWISLKGGDLVGTYGFDARVRQFSEPAGGMARFGRLQRAGATLDYNNEETNYTLGLAELSRRLKRRSLVVLFTEFVDTISAELMIESLGRMAKRHVVMFVTLQDPSLGARIAASPRQFEQVAEAVVAHDFLRERQVVLERIGRLGIHCIDTPVGKLSANIMNRYLMIKQRGLI